MSISPRLQCFSCRTPVLSELDSCYSGDALEMTFVTCHATHTHCSTITGGKNFLFIKKIFFCNINYLPIAINGVPTLSRGCHQGCRDSDTIQCCNTNLCNVHQNQTETF